MLRLPRLWYQNTRHSGRSCEPSLCDDTYCGQDQSLGSNIDASNITNTPKVRFLSKSCPIPHRRVDAFWNPVLYNEVHDGFIDALTTQSTYRACSVANSIKARPTLSYGISVLYGHIIAHDSKNNVNHSNFNTTSKRHP